MKYPKRISDISERAFWLALRSGGNAELAEAIRLGKSGERAAAYAALGDYHRHKLADELVAQRAQFGANIQVLYTSQKAEDLLRHRITVWQSTVVDFGPRIDWNYPHTDQYGFHYLGWLAPGVQRLFDGDEPVYRKCLMNIVESYYNSRNNLHHPIPGSHLVYYELGCWAKMVVLLPLYLALLDSGKIPVGVHEAFLKLFLGFGRSLYEHQQEYRSGNWQIAGCSGLFILSRVFPEFAESRQWEERALQYLGAHLQKDFFADGGHEERCWTYGLLTLNAHTEAYQAGLRHGGLGEYEKLFLKAIRQAYRWYAKTLGPTEHMPAFGDGKLGSGSAILDAAQAYFPQSTGRSLGVDRGKSYLLRPSGYAIMRNGDKPDSAYLNLSFGKFSGWHAHMDCLSLNFWALGEALIEEFGMVGGYGEALSLLGRAPESHNQLTIDGMHYDNSDHTLPGQRVHISGCAWDHPDFANRIGRDVVWQSSPEIDFFTAWHNAYRANWREPQTVDVHVRRTVIFVKNPGYVLVSDYAWEPVTNNEGPNFSVTQNWHSPMPFKVLAPGLARTWGKTACLLAFAPQPYLRRLEPGIDYAGDEAPQQQKYSERYYLRARRWMPVEHRGATGVTTVLYPFRGQAPAIQVETLPLHGEQLFRSGSFAVNTPHGRDVFTLNPDGLSGIKVGGKKFGKKATVQLGNGRGEMEID